MTSTLRQTFGTAFEALIAQMYNACGAMRTCGDHTRFVLLYDEHGGFYDHVEPPTTVAPDKNTQTFGFNVLGVRFRRFLSLRVVTLVCSKRNSITLAF